MLQSAASIYANQAALDRYNDKWSGMAAGRTQILYTAACRGLDVDAAVALQDHVLALFGHTQAKQLAHLSEAAQAWVDWMLK